MISISFEPNRRIFVYNICLISVSDTVFDGATGTLLLNIKIEYLGAQRNELSQLVVLCFFLNKFLERETRLSHT